MIIKIHSVRNFLTPQQIGSLTRIFMITFENSGNKTKNEIDMLINSCERHGYCSNEEQIFKNVMDSSKTITNISVPSRQEI